MPILTREEPMPDDVHLWLDASSAQLLYDATAQFSDEEQEDKMNIEPLATLLQSPQT